MDLILWRHAEAEPGEPDLGRRLTTKGRRQAEQVAAWLEGHLPDTARILVSPAERAQQTAHALRRKFRTIAELGPGASVETVVAASGWPDARVPFVVVVGHQPTLGGVVSSLLCGEPSFWTIKKGSLWWLSNRPSDARGSVIVRAVVGPDTLCRLPHLPAIQPSAVAGLQFEPRAYRTPRTEGDA